MTNEAPTYPAVNFIVRHGPAVAIALPLALLAVWTAISVAYGFPLWTLVLAAAAAVVLFGLLRSYVEIVQVIAETLLPR